MPSHFDCIVIGLGGFGSAAACSAARRGVHVLGLDQFGPAHDRGSSHGETRIIRRAYFEHPDYVPLADRSYRLWETLEAETGQELFRRTGLILAGPADGEAVAGTLRAAREHRLSVDDMSAAEAGARFPAFHFGEQDRVVHESDAGLLHVEACVQAHLDAAVRHGATLRFGEVVTTIESQRSSVRVATATGEYTAPTAIVAAGAWSSRLLADLGIPLVVKQKVQLWHPVRPSGAVLHAQSPGFLFQQPEGVFYGFPCLDGETVKVAEHSGGEPVDDPAQVDRTLRPADVAPVAGFVRRSLPHVDPRPRRHSVCMYTMSPDGHFIVDRHPARQNVVVAAGFSGHGFKFTPVIGEALVDLAMNGRTDIPIGFLGLARFGENE